MQARNDFQSCSASLSSNPGDEQQTPSAEIQLCRIIWLRYRWKIWLRFLPSSWPSSHTHTHCTLLLIQSLSLPSALLEEFDLTWESMNSSTQQNIALPQSTGSRQESVLYADVSLDMLLDELSLLFGYYLCDKGTFVQKCTIAVVLSIPTTFKSDQDFCAWYDTQI